jgi:hypothetical protein
VADNEPTDDEILKSCILFFEIVGSGPAGRDAFVLVLVHFWSADAHRQTFENFQKFAEAGGLLRARSYLATAIVTALDGECLPSHTRLLQAFLAPLVKFLVAIAGSFRPSPFVERIGQVGSLYVDKGQSLLSPIHIALKLSRRIWATGKVSEDPMGVIICLAKELYRPNVFLAFAQLGFAVYSHISINPVAVRHACEIIALIFPIMRDGPAPDIIELWLHLLTKSLMRALDGKTIGYLLKTSTSPRELLGAIYLAVEGGFANGIWRSSPTSVIRVVEQMAFTEIRRSVILISRLIASASEVESAVGLLIDVLCRAAHQGWRYFVRLAAPILQLPDVAQYIKTEGCLERLVDAALEAVSSISAAEAGASKALVFVWRTLATLGTVPSIVELVRLSTPLSTGNEDEKQCFAEGLMECISSEWIDILEPVIRELPFDAFIPRSVGVAWRPECWLPEVTGLMVCHPP